MNALLMVVCLAFPQGTEQDEIHSLKKDINLLNLVNGLHLTRAQAEGLVTIQRDLEQIRQKLQPELHTVVHVRRQRIKALDDIKKSLLADKEAERSLLRQAFQPLNVIGGGEIGRLNRLLRQRQAEAVNRVINLLAQEQRQVLVTYKACLIPPKDLKDPVRVGQAQDNSYGKRILDRIRRMPASRFTEGPLAVTQGVLRQMERKGGTLLPEQRRQAETSVCKIIEETRALSDLDYVLRVDDLAERLGKWDRHYAARKLIQDTAAMGLVRKNVAAFLLDPRLPALLAEKAKVCPLPESNGLAALTEAENCDRGGCALPDSPKPKKPQPRKPRNN